MNRRPFMRQAPSRRKPQCGKCGGRPARRACWTRCGSGRLAEDFGKVWRFENVALPARAEAAISLTSAPVRASIRGGSGERRAAKTPSPIPSRTVHSAATRYDRKRAGALPPSSNDTQAANCLLDERFFNHSTSRGILPDPAGAETRVSFRPGSRSIRSVRRRRATRSGRACEGRSLVDTSEPDVRGAWLASGAYSTSDHYSTDTPGCPYRAWSLRSLVVAVTTLVVRRACAPAKPAATSNRGVIPAPRVAVSGG